MPKENFVHEYIHRPIVKNISYNNMKLAKLRKFEFFKSKSFTKIISYYCSKT